MLPPRVRVFGRINLQYTARGGLEFLEYCTRKAIGTAEISDVGHGEEAPKEKLPRPTLLMEPIDRPGRPL